MAVVQCQIAGCLRNFPTELRTERYLSRQLHDREKTNNPANFVWKRKK